MKNKITKLFLALLAIASTNYVNAQEQGETMPDYIRKATNIEFLNKFAQEKAAEFEVNYKKAVEIARAEGKPISGEKDGMSYALAGYDEETGGLIYNSTYNNNESAQDMFFNNVPVGSSLQTANAKPLHANGIIGSGMVVGVWDGGAGLPNHLAFAGGRYQVRNNANSGANSDGKDHAAHVAGTVAGASFGVEQRTKGFAYGAIVHAYNGINAYDIPAMTSATTATTNPVYVSNHSYGLNFGQSSLGSSVFGLYNSRAREYDVLANNAPHYTIVFAAGNDRTDNYNPGKGGKDLLSQAGVSKNLVVVAATRGTEDYSGITGITSVSSVGGVNAFITPYSNYGPTDDFRIKPDIAAKGGVMPSDPVVSVGNTTITSTAQMQGTSMAAPAVTGVFTLWQGYYKTLNNNNYMKSASVRALMAHTAREAGPSAGPDFMFGWGLIDAAKGIDVIDQAKAKTAILRELELPQGHTLEYEFTYDGVEPLVVTIAWNDPAGAVSTIPNLDIKKLVNDLDLRLINTDTNEIYYPWSLKREWNIAPTSTSIAVNDIDNERDNIEKIEPDGAVAGNYQVIVNHKGALQGGNQDYTLIVSGAGGTMNDPDPASIENLALNNLNIYPNPVDSVLNISGDLQALSNAKAYIFDISGKKVKDVSLNFDNNHTSLDVSDLKAGTYILTLSKDASKQSYKFIKK